MAAPGVAGIRRTTAIESIQSTAATLAERYGVPNLVADVDFDYIHLENVDRGGSALFQARLAEMQAAMFAMFASCLEKITPAG